MTNKFPVVPDTVFTEREGVHYLGLVSSRMGFIWRELGNTDLGIDGYLEVVVNGAPIGLIAVQVKSGSKKYMKLESDTDFTFRAETKHVRYWLSYRLPVIVIVYDPRSRIAYWYSIQDYFKKHNEAPDCATIPIRISKRKADQFEQSQEKLQEIASLPDSTAHAMLALRASRYKTRQELLTPIEMIELYEKRKWLGEWLPLDNTREELLLHSSLGKIGPAWYWFRDSKGYLPYLRSALNHPNNTVKQEAILVLGAIGKEAVKDLLNELLCDPENVIDIAKALVLINDFTEKDRKQIVNHLWQSLDNDKTRQFTLDKLSLIAVLGGSEQQKRVVERYTRLYASDPRLLRTASALWKKSEIETLRRMAQSVNDIDRTLAVITLAQIGGREDLSLIVQYITSRNWINNEDCHWLSKVTSRLFTESDFNNLMQRLGHNNRYDQIIAYEALSTLCRKLDEATLLSLLKSDDLNVQRYGVTGLTTTGNWEIINRWWKRDEFRGAIIESLRYVKDEKAQNMLFELLGDKSDQLRLKAGESLACTRDENVLERVIAQLIKNPYGQEADIMCAVARHLDRSLYSPIKWERDLERDFTFLRYSVTRDD